MGADLILHSTTMAVVRLSPVADRPDWVTDASFSCITRTDNELSIVCDQRLVPKDVQSEGNWQMLEVKGPLDFQLTGILASLVVPLSEARVPVFALSTYDTDYILVKSHEIDRACQALNQAGHHIDKPAT